ncbi:glycoside hydrolase [Brucellaceae bacterium C25G]
MESAVQYLLIAFASALLLCIFLLGGLCRILPDTFLSARKNARSNHLIAARQIGGLALVPTILILLGLFYQYSGLSFKTIVLLEMSGWLLWLTGLMDDRFELSVRLRLLLQLISAVLGVAALGDQFRLLSFLPVWFEFGLLVFAMLVWINVTNFMDGLDLMTVSGIGIPVLWIGLFACLGLTGLSLGLVSVLIAGALSGFAFFNRHPAKVFLGDSGSLPLGMLSCFVFLSFANQTSVWLALILPLYYVLDASTTIFIRLRAGENIFEAHSRHAYQKARRAGLSVWQVVVTVALLNVFLGAFVWSWFIWPSLWYETVLFLIATLITVSLIVKFRTINS